MKQDADVEKAESARMSSFVGAIAVGDLVKSTLGPKGMDKILVGRGRNDGKVTWIFTGKYLLINNYGYSRSTYYVVWHLQFKLSVLILIICPLIETD